MRHSPLLLVATLLVAALLGCVPQPVRWDETVLQLPAALADSARLTMDVATGAATIVGASSPATWPDESGQCVSSRRAVLAPDGEAYASWFSARPDSSAWLRVARSVDGGRTWVPAVTADSTDVGRRGCDRPAPFIGADSLSGHVQVVYHLVAREGAGIFFTHSMDRGALFHEPVPIVYGDRPSAAAVASRGDTVVVAFEDPNSRQPRVGLALSRTQGHIFFQRIAASDENGEARTPRVAVRGGRIAVAWTVTQRGGSGPRGVLRTGTLVW